MRGVGSNTQPIASGLSFDIWDSRGFVGVRNPYTYVQQGIQQGSSAERRISTMRTSGEELGQQCSKKDDCQPSPPG